MTYANALEIYMLDLINAERATHGLRALQLETNLNSSAESHTLWMLETNTFSHTGVNGSSATERIVDAGFDYVGTRGTSENLAIQTTRGPEGFFDDVMDLHIALLNSPGHRANLLSSTREYIGIGIEVGSFVYSGGATAQSLAITQNFGRTEGSVDLDDLMGGRSEPALPDLPEPALPDLPQPALPNLPPHTGTAADEVLSGTTGNDTLIGGGGADTLEGGGGDDVLIGGTLDALSNQSGGDSFSGGAGRDAVSYEGSFGSLRVDLQFSQVNTFAAAGDTYDSIEDIIGSQGADNIRGNQEGNILSGGRNVDYIFGRRGEDTLEGGIGDDVLFGGIGADDLRGGENRDRAQYSESQTAVRIDLDDTSRNTGEAAGDTYTSIEDLAGSQFNDTISGDAGSNRLFGRAGSDMLDGRDGNDYLNGGSGQDTLAGNAGDDVLRGGASRDTFVFDSGHDVIEDWFLDQINLDRDLWGGADRTAQDILSTFASVEGNNTVFDFGAGNSLTLQGVTDLETLEPYLFDV